MLSAIVAVAAITGGVMLASVRVFGTDGAGTGGRGSPIIGAPADAVAAMHPAPGQSDSSASASPDPEAMIATQPALPAPSSAKPSPSKTAASQTKTTTVQTANTSMEDQVVALVNTERATAGCSAVTVDSRLTTAARGHSSDMATRGYFSHDTPEGVTFSARITKAGYTWSTAGENIAMGQSTAAAVMKAWMNSSGHKANILNCSFRNIGVGLAYNSSKRPYWTQDFGTLR
ncbi:MAG: CAP domain-containing protein [Dactylosporangium sp.]|nr:CAP domain-containing protein [Dactylosporangium sp.]